MKTETRLLLEKLDKGLPPPPDAGFLGIDIDPQDAELVIINVPWDVTTSYRPGTHRGPEAVKAASHQLDLFDRHFGKPYWRGLAMLEAPQWLTELNEMMRPVAEEIIEAVSSGTTPDAAKLAKVNQASDRVNAWVQETAMTYHHKDKVVAVLGGDHSCPYGLMQALAMKHKEGFGILHIDAHHDLRDAYEGFKHSHASIMFNALSGLPAPVSLTAVAIRDYSYEEWNLAKQDARIHPYYADEIFNRLAHGTSYHEVTRNIIQTLPQNVYISFDIDGLEPGCCPNTGTPVPGGMTYHQAIHLIETLALAGKRIVGFDLCEVAPHLENEGDEWDANVGARILYKLCGALLFSRHGRIDR